MHVFQVTLTDAQYESLLPLARGLTQLPDDNVAMTDYVQVIIQHAANGQMEINRLVSDKDIERRKALVP